MDDGGELAKAMADMQKELANMPPEDRKQMEKALAAQGMQLGTGAGGMSARVCMSQQMVERSELPMSQQGNCRNTRHQRSGNTVKMAYTCTQPNSSGEGEFTMLSREAYTSRMVITDSGSGKPEKVTMSGSGKWLSADCGGLKPLGAAAKP
jgi:hypothetical protein